ncbi:hypothetical protein QTJ16_001418 [Diplocarpon rosae]|uniref:Uncharacterized protein n=1 Tax=Diplocarpon rosae TaxID=946125 RepID=A0AAD9T7T1_9HELO|nr:hypothetical protein QTJ16_001418 [Diplocarpon rosae]
MKRQQSFVAPVATPPATYTSTYPQIDAAVPCSPVLDLDMLLQAGIAREKSSVEPDPDSELGSYVRPRRSEPKLARLREAPNSTGPSFQHHTEEQRVGTLSDVNETAKHTRRTETPTPVSATGGSTIYLRDEKPQVIDTLPKAKQGQVYSVICGLQGSIDQLQKQLVSLKAQLGS